MVINEGIAFERILCPVDLLPDSEAALRYAASFARVCGARLLICHCRELPDEGRRPERARRISSLDSLVRQAGSDESAPVWESFVVDGDPVVAIPRVAAEKRVDLILMRSRKWQHPEALLGSIAEAICRMSPCPVLITHPRDRETAESTDSSLRRVLVPYDFSSDAELALAYGLHLCNKHRAELHLLHILPSRVKTEAPEVAMLPLSARPGFDEIKNRLRSAVSRPVNPGTEIKHALREGQPYREVLAYAEEQAIDLISMGANGSGFGLHALFGSNADRVLRQAQCPVIIARPLRPTMPIAR